MKTFEEQEIAETMVRKKGSKNGIYIYSEKVHKRNEPTKTKLRVD